MLNLLQIEFKKIIPFRSFWVIAGLYLLFIPSVLFAVGEFEIKEFQFNLNTIYEFPLVWNFITYLASWFNLLLIGLLVIILVSNEFRFKTFRQHVIDGQSRLDFFKGKMLLIVTLALSSTFYLFLVGLIFGFSFTETIAEGAILKDINYLFIYFIQTIGYMVVALLIGVLIRSSALAIILFILSPIIENIIKLIPKFAFPETPIYKYFPMEIISNLTPYPVPDNMLAQEMKKTLLNDVIPLSTSIAFGVVYIVIFCGLSYWMLNKKDIK